MSASGLMAGLLSLQKPELCQKVIKSLLFLLYHSFPKVRKLTAEKLYTGLLGLEDPLIVFPNGEVDYDAAIEMLSETNWTA